MTPHLWNSTRMLNSGFIPLLWAIKNDYMAQPGQATVHAYVGWGHGSLLVRACVACASIAFNRSFVAHADARAIASAGPS